MLIALGAASAFVAATGVGAVGLAAVGTGLAVLGWAALGWDGLRYIYDVFKIIREIDNYEESDCAGLDSLADKLYDRTVQLESAVIQELTGAKIGDLISKLARRIKGSKGDADTTRPTDNQSCSFAGNTIVLSRRGAVPIQDLVAGNDEVWAREEATGTMGWQPVLSHYHNTYDSTVAVSIRSGLGVEQIIESNEIHPYFARLPEGSKAPTSNSEGHDYDGSIDRGHWVDAINLQPGYQLLGSDGNWQSVVGVMIRAESLKAFNLTVANYNTYFVAGNDDARGVWVHNKCWDELDDLPKGTEPKGKNDFGQDQFEGPDGRIIYKGEDGRYYDAIDHPPGPKRNPEGPLADGYERDGKDIVGPEGGRYTDVGTDRNGNGVYKDKDGNFYTLKDGKPHYNPDRFRTGLTAERLVTKDLDEKGWERVGGTADDNVSGTIDADIPGYQGQQGIDGIYKRKNPQTGETEYLVVETKGSTTNNAGPMSNTKDGNQLSKKWIDNRIRDESKGGLSSGELRRFEAASQKGNVTTVKAEVTNVKAGKTVHDSTGDINYKTVKEPESGKIALGESYDPKSSG